MGCEFAYLIGYVGYCVKDNGKEQFKIVYQNVSMDNMNEHTMEYSKFVKVR